LQVVALGHILIRVRGRQDNNWDSFEFVVGFDFGQRFSTVFARHVEIEQDQFRSWSVGELSFPSQKTHGLDTILGNVKLVVDLPVGQRLPGQ